MPAWIMAALLSLRGAAVGTPGRALITGATAGSLIQSGLGADEGGAGVDTGFLGFLGGGGGGRPRRRRRRRALTKSDMQDLAFLAGFLSKAGVERAAAIILART